MKIAFIFGKGIDGCGVTRGALIFEEWLRAAGHDTLTVDFDNDQSFGRAQDANFIGPVYTVTKKDQDASTQIIDAVNSCDIAIFHSHPTRKQGPFVDRYRRFMEKISNPIIVIHDHSIAKTNINAIPQAAEIFAKADVAVIQSLNGFSNEVYSNFDSGLTGRFIENPIWIKPHQFDTYRKPFEEREKHLVYIGRMSPLKDPAMLCRIEPKMPVPWRMSLIGCEYSISSVSTNQPLDINAAPYVPEFRKKIHQYRTKSDGSYVLMPAGAPADFPARITSYDRYKYQWGMEQLGSSFASWCGYKLSDPEEYGTRMEYTMIESFLLTLPIMNRHFAENARSPEGKLWGEYDGPLVSQAREEKELADELVRVTAFRKEWIDRTEACKSLIYKFNDIENIGQKFLDQVLALGKRTNKVDPLEVIKPYFPDAADRRAKGEVIMTTGTGTLNKIPYVLIDGKQVEVSKIKESSNSLEEFFG